MNLSLPLSVLAFLAVLPLATGQTDTFHLDVCARFWRTGEAVPNTTFSAQLPAQLESYSPDKSCVRLAFSPAVSVDSFCGVSATRPELNPLNGVTVRDMWVMRQHVLGTAPAPHPAAVLASDLNQSGSVSTWDILQLHNWLLGKPAQNLPGWRFFPDSSMLIFNPNNPFQWPGCMGYQFVPGTTFGQAGLTALKIGDADGDARVSGDYLPEYLNPSAQLILPELPLVAGQVYELPVAIKSAGKCLGIQFSLAADPNFLVLDSAAAVQANLGGDQWNMLGDTVLRYVGLLFPAADLPDGTVLLRLRVKVLQDCFSNEEIALTQQGLPGAVLGENELFAPLNAVFEVSSLETPICTGMAIGLPEPNPFREKTFLPIRLDAAQTVELRVWDLAGKLLAESENRLAAGAHRLEILGGEVPGVYFVQLRTEAGVWAFRVVKI